MDKYRGLGVLPLIFVSAPFLQHGMVVVPRFQKIWQIPTHIQVFCSLGNDQVHDLRPFADCLVLQPHIFKR